MGRTQPPSSHWPIRPPLRPPTAAAVADLNDYETEAMDILWVMELYGYSVKKAVSGVLRETFLIDLDKKELEHYSNRIKSILGK